MRQFTTEQTNPPCERKHRAHGSIQSTHNPRLHLGVRVVALARVGAPRSRESRQTGPTSRSSVGASIGLAVGAVKAVPSERGSQRSTKDSSQSLRGEEPGRAACGKRGRVADTTDAAGVGVANEAPQRLPACRRPRGDRGAAHGELGVAPGPAHPTHEGRRTRRVREISPGADAGAHAGADGGAVVWRCFGCGPPS
jgi:hypothetical protein